VKLVDANVLIYSVNDDSPRFHEARSWLHDALSGQASIGFAWINLVAFVRVSTSARAMPGPLTVEQAMRSVHDWLSSPSARIVAPTARHAFILHDLLAQVGTGGNLVNDAHLAALAIEHRAEVITYDTDFAQFPGVRWAQPRA
jgi:toxin-antitoxin system PIN domain toxin